MNKKYELIPSDVKGLYRIKSLRDFSDIKKGNIGGYIEKEENLSHEGDCWVYGDTRVYGNALVYGNAWVYEDSKVYGHARVYENAQVSGDARVYGNAKII